MVCLLWLFLIYFCLEREIIITLGTLDNFVPRVDHDSESLSHLGPKIWKSVPIKSKQKSAVKTFKESIKL